MNKAALPGGPVGASPSACKPMVCECRCRCNVERRDEPDYDLWREFSWGVPERDWYGKYGWWVS